jgi:HEPN domain-containing protein
MDLTYEGRKSDAAAWYSGALLFFEAAQVLHDAQLSGGRVFSYNAGMSLEIIFKSILARKQIDIPPIHILRTLATMASLQFDQHQNEMLEFLTECIVWAGRYPVPKNAEQFKKYNDEVVERHIIRTSVPGRTYVTLNPKNDPCWPNYLRVWNICVAEFENLESANAAATP